MNGQEEMRLTVLIEPVEGAEEWRAWLEDDASEQATGGTPMEALVQLATRLYIDERREVHD